MNARNINPTDQAFMLLGVNAASAMVGGMVAGIALFNPLGATALVVGGVMLGVGAWMSNQNQPN